MRDLAAGDILGGRYELLLPIAKGGMAQVWAARLRGSRGFQKIVAVKTILAGAIDDARMERMFLEEASLASQIHHPNVVGTLELGDQEGTLFLVMEWVDGESLNFILTSASSGGGIPLPIAVNLIGQACQGLHAAHELRDESGKLLGVVHRDISPQNVLVTYSGHAKLVDFGIAKATERASDHTEDGIMKGKYAYVSPEQVSGQAIDRRADIFSMGVVLYLFTTGHHPFKGAHPTETLRNICSSQPPVLPSTHVPGYPLGLQEVVLKALAKAPNDRWATANEMLLALEHAMPQCLEGSFEIEVANYLKQLVGPHARERRMQLQRAQVRADRNRVDGLETATTGSLNVREALTESIGTGEGTPGWPNTGTSTRGVESPVLKGRAKRPPWIAAITLIGALLLLGSFARRRLVDPGRDSALSAPQPASTPAPTAVEVPIPVPLPAPTPTAAPLVAPEQETPKDAKDAASKRSRSTPAAPQPRAPAVAQLAAAPTQTAPPAATPTTTRNEPREPATSNAWDPGTFGGRR